MSKLTEIFSEFHQGQKNFGDDIARLVNSILLTAVYFVGVGFSWVLTRFSKNEILEIELDKKAKTYWKPLNLTTKPIKEYYKQF